jgi:hypothetical protein
MKSGSRWLFSVALVLVAGAIAVLVREHGAHAPTPAAASTEAAVADAAAVIPDDPGPARSAAPAPTPASPDGEDSRAVAAQLERELTLQIERALVSQDPAAREAAFAFALPELLRLTPTGVIGLIARQPAGPARDALRDETARHWVRSNRDAAVEWIRALPDADRSAAATTAMRTLAASSPPEAIRLAEDLGVGHDDGSIEHIARIWAESEPEAARRWRAARGASAR